MGSESELAARSFEWTFGDVLAMGLRFPDMYAFIDIRLSPEAPMNRFKSV
jgi:hypothetical protein